MARGYWLDLFSAETWQEFIEHGGDVSGFSENRAKQVAKIKVGDYLLCYLTGESRWVGVLEVTEPYFHSEEPVWSSRLYPERLGVKVIAALTPETGVPVLDMRDELSVFADLKNPNAWSGAFRGSPGKWTTPDGEAVVRAVLAAWHNPVERDLKKPRRAGVDLSADEQELTDVPGLPVIARAAMLGERDEHTEIEYLLLKMGAEMGFNVHICRDDANREWNGTPLKDLPRVRDSLPVPFDEATKRTIEYIDVLWSDKHRIVAAFEVERTTAIYSGLVRLCDLVAMQGNIQIPLFVAVPAARRDKVIREANRPTFARREYPLPDFTAVITFDDLRDAVERYSDVLPDLKESFLQRISTPCALGDP